MAPAADMRRSLESSGKFMALVLAEVSVVLSTTFVNSAVTWPGTNVVARELNALGTHFLLVFSGDAVVYTGVERADSNTLFST